VANLHDGRQSGAGAGDHQSGAASSRGRVHPQARDVQALFFMARVRTYVGTVRQLIDALSLALEKLIKHGGQQQ